MKGNRNLKRLVKSLNDNFLLSQQLEQSREIWVELFQAAMLHLRKADKRGFMGDEARLGEKKIASYFREWVSFENLLFASYSFQRDHSIHSLRIYLLGDYCINKCWRGYNRISSTITTLGAADDDIFKNIPADVKEAIWCVIALTHDMGETLEKIKEINSKIRAIVADFGELGIQEFNITFSPHGINVNDKLLEIISSRLSKPSEGENYVVHLQPKFHVKYETAFERFNHGLLSALLLFKICLYFKEIDIVHPGNGITMSRDDAENFVIRREILRAIGSHDVSEIFHLRLTQFDTLLILFDELQEWDRPLPAHRFKNKQGTNVVIEHFKADRVNFTIYFADTVNARKYFNIKVQRFSSFFRSGLNLRNSQYPPFIVMFKLVPVNSREYGIYIYRFEGQKSRNYTHWGRGSREVNQHIKELCGPLPRMQRS